MYDNQNEEPPWEESQRPPQRQAEETKHNAHVRPMTESEVESVNTVIRQAESITQALLKAWKIRDSLRQVVAEMTCPWRVGDVLVLNDGRGPRDRRVVTAVLSGKTEEGEFFRVRTRVLKRGQTPGKAEMWLKMNGELVVGVLGRFSGVLPKSELVELMEV